MFDRSRMMELFWNGPFLRLPTYIHLLCAELELRAAPVGHLPGALRAARAAHLDRLASYRRARQYPASPPGLRTLSPCFRDQRGTLCAVAHLMHQSGAADVVGEIAWRENLAKVAEMRTPALADWIAESGLTAAEVARIQPQYGPFLHHYQAYSLFAAEVAAVAVAALWTIVLNLASVVWVRTSRVISSLVGIFLGVILVSMSAAAHLPHAVPAFTESLRLADWALPAMALGYATVAVAGLRLLCEIQRRSADAGRWSGREK